MEREIPYNIKVIAENLNIPWAIAVSDNRLYFTERSGTIRVIEEGRLLADPLYTFSPPFISRGEGGLMGIALDPDFQSNRQIYVMHTYLDGDHIYNCVIRLLEQGNRAVIDRVLLDGIPGGQIHNGGRIKFGPDRMLYITTGDSGNPALAQDLTSTAGKILRINPDGSIPEDNPFQNSPVFSYGHRNPQGLAWNTNQMLYASEHGRTAHDEINIIFPGGNYGWPIVQGDEDVPDLKLQKPLIHSNENTWAPSGMTFINQGPWNGRLLVACLRGMQLLVITLNQTGTGVMNIESELWNEYGRLREVVQAADGSIYLTTNNRDGRGSPARNDDRIIRLTGKEV
jgi:glucose/arabinose dehydrogenase